MGNRATSMCKYKQNIDVNAILKLKNLATFVTLLQLYAGSIARVPGQEVMLLSFPLRCCAKAARNTKNQQKKSANIMLGWNESFTII